MKYSFAGNLLKNKHKIMVLFVFEKSQDVKIMEEVFKTKDYILL